MLTRDLRRGALAATMLAVLAVLGAAAHPARACTGDCDASGAVAVNEAVRGVGIALGHLALAECPIFDGNDDRRVTIDELLLAVRAMLGGCAETPAPSQTPTAAATTTGTPAATGTETATPPSTPTATAPATATATELPSPTPTPTAIENRPPMLPPAAIYRTYGGAPIALPLGAVDPDGDPLRCDAETLPAGAVLDGEVLHWTPTGAQVGAFAVPFSCADTGNPPLTAAGELLLKVAPLDPCSRPSCDPAAGCTNALPPVGAPCCAAVAVPRIGEPDAGCPAGRIAFLGRNLVGFGRLQNCDLMRVRNFAQSGAQVSFHVEARCLRITDHVDVAVRIETAHRLLVDSTTRVFLLPGSDGFARARNIGPFEVGGPAPYFDIQNAEANVTVTLTDADGMSATERLRLRLTFSNPPALPEAPPGI